MIFVGTSITDTFDDKGIRIKLTLGRILRYISFCGYLRGDEISLRLSPKRRS